MSYTALDLDGSGKLATDPEESSFEIIEGEDTPETEEEESVIVPNTETPAPEPEEDEDEGEVEEPSAKKKLTRSQRLKAQRDALASRAAAAEAELEELRGKVTKYEADAHEGAAIGLDLHIQNIEGSMKALRLEYDAAFANGDKDALFDVQTKMSDLAAQKHAAIRERANFPTKGSGGPAAQQPTPQTTAPTPQTTPKAGSKNPLAIAWYEENKEWFGKDAVMTQVARVVDQQIVADGYDVNDPEFFEEFNRRMRAELPHKFAAGGVVTKSKPKSPGVTIQNRAPSPTGNGKIQVKITPADRQMADQLGITIEQFARQKARREAASNNANGYTEIG